MPPPYCPDNSLPSGWNSTSFLILQTKGEEGLCAESRSLHISSIAVTDHQVKYQQAKVTRPLDESDYEPPPPPISNGFFAWFSPVIHLKEEQMIQNIGMSSLLA